MENIGRKLKVVFSINILNVLNKNHPSMTKSEIINISNITSTHSIRI